MNNTISINSFNRLAAVIEQTHLHFLQQVQKQVNVALTLRNWLIGQYIVEYEQNGSDRAEYGRAMIARLSEKLRQRNLKGFSEIALRLNRSFYLTYPTIQQTVSVNLQNTDSHNNIIQPTLSVKFEKPTPSETGSGIDVYLLLNSLSFSHFIELMKAPNALARSFYEVEAIKNNLTVRELQRAMKWKKAISRRLESSCAPQITKAL